MGFILGRALGAFFARAAGAFAFLAALDGARRGFFACPAAAAGAVGTAAGELTGAAGSAGALPRMLPAGSPCVSRPSPSSSKYESSAIASPCPSDECVSAGLRCQRMLADDRAIGAVNVEWKR